MVLELKKFDMNCINFERGAPVIFIIGRRDTGKSFLVRDILYHNKDVPMSTVVSGTESIVRIVKKIILLKIGLLIFFCCNTWLLFFAFLLFYGCPSRYIFCPSRYIFVLF